MDSRKSYELVDGEDLLDEELLHQLGELVEVDIDGLRGRRRSKGERTLPVLFFFKRSISKVRLAAMEASSSL